MSRIKELQKQVNKILEKKEDGDKRAKAIANLHGVALAAAVLAKRRGEDECICADTDKTGKTGQRPGVDGDAFIAFSGGTGMLEENAEVTGGSEDTDGIRPICRPPLAPHGWAPDGWSLEDVSESLRSIRCIQQNGRGHEGKGGAAAEDLCHECK